MKELENNEVRLQDAPGYKETAEMYFSVKIKAADGQVDEDRTAATIYELVKPLVRIAQSEPQKMRVLEKLAKKEKEYNHTSILAKLRFEL